MEHFEMASPSLQSSQPLAHADSPLRALAGGLLATGTMTLLMYLGGHVEEQTMGFLAGLPAALGLSGPRLMAIHVALGAVAFPLLYTRFFRETLAGSYSIRGVVFGAGLWLLAMVGVSPLLTLGLFLGGPGPAIASMTAHLWYGLVLGISTALGDPFDDARRD